jgi:hypothetical protein
VLTRDWLAGCHPLAAAAALLGPERFRDHATAAFADLRALSHDAAQRGPGVASWFEQAHARAWQAFAERHQLDWHGSRAAPPRESPRVLAYCPRCAAQYERIGGNCADCEGVALQPFPAA